MKRVLLMLLGAVFMLSSCSVSGNHDLKSGKTTNDNKACIVDPYYGRLDTTFTSITNAISSKNKSDIKELFANNVISQDVAFEESLDLLLSFVQGEIASIDKKGSSGATSSDGDYKSVIEQAWYIVKTDEECYIFVIVECLEDTMNPKNVGVHTLRVLREADKEKYFASWDDVMIPGIYVGGQGDGLREPF